MAALTIVFLCAVVECGRMAWQMQRRLAFYVHRQNCIICAQRTFSENEEHLRVWGCRHASDKFTGIRT